MHQVCCNGRFFPEDQPVITLQNRNFKYGDGIFETIRVSNGKIMLEEFHFERLISSLRLLKIAASPAFIQTIIPNIYQLCKLNNCLASARVRLSVFREQDGGASYAMEAVPLPVDNNVMNSEGLKLVLYPGARRNADAFSNLKTSNFLVYVMAALYAKEYNADDSLVMNGQGHISETTKANLFLIKGNEILTPALDQGCINGVMRRYLIAALNPLGYNISEGIVKEEHLLAADEVFITNAIIRMQWVRSFSSVTYSYDKISEIFQRIFKR